jgi:pyruvate formate lyase activating enzyme
LEPVIKIGCTRFQTKSIIAACHTLPLQETGQCISRIRNGEFLTELLTLSKERGLHTAIETSGFASPALIEKIAPLTDLFLFDIKETNDERHKELTGVPFTPIYENLKLLDSLGANIVLRCPLIPDINTDDRHIESIAKIAAELKSVSEVNVMAYHTLGNGKYDAIGFENKMAGRAAMTDEEKSALVLRIAEKIKSLGKDIKVS